MFISASLQLVPYSSPAATERDASSRSKRIDLYQVDLVAIGPQMHVEHTVFVRKHRRDHLLKPVSNRAGELLDAGSDVGVEAHIIVLEQCGELPAAHDAPVLVA